MSKMGKYLERSHGDELGIAYKILQLRGKKASAVEVSRGKTPHGEMKAAGSLFIRRNECCHVPPLLSIHQDLCQLFPLVVFKLQHDNRKQEIKALAQFSDSNLIASGTKIGLMRMIFFFFHYCDKASKTKQTQLLQSGPEY